MYFLVFICFLLWDFNLLFLYFLFQCRLIVSQMSNTRCECFHWMTPLFVFCIFTSCWLPFFERFLLYMLFLVTTLCHWHYGYSVVNQMCIHFNRICFSVQMRNDISEEIKKNGRSSDLNILSNLLKNQNEQFMNTKTEISVEDVKKMEWNFCSDDIFILNQIVRMALFQYNLTICCDVLKQFVVETKT